MDSDANPEDDEVIHIATNSFTNGARLQPTTLRKQFKLIEHRRKVRKGTPIHLPSTNKTASASQKRPATISSGSQLHPLLPESSRTTLLPSNLNKIVGSTSKHAGNETSVNWRPSFSLSVTNADAPMSRNTITTNKLDETSNHSNETRKAKRNSMVEISSDEDDRPAQKDLHTYGKKNVVEKPSMPVRRNSIKRRNGADAGPSAISMSKKRRSSWDVRSIESKQDQSSMSRQPASASNTTSDTVNNDIAVLPSLSLSNIVCDGKRVPSSPSQVQKMFITKNNEIALRSQSKENKFEKNVPRRTIRTLEYYAGNSSGLHMKLEDETRITVVLSPIIEANEFTRFLTSLKLDSFCIAPFEKAEWEKIVASEGLPLFTNKRTHDAHKEANLPEDNTSKEETLSQAVLPENTGADETLFVYPFTGYGGITVSKADEARLDDGEFLNDNIIDFYMKWILDQLHNRDPELAKQVHIFNSFFYKRLTQRNRNSRKEETVYDRVKKWTAKMNLFDKSYVFIPINENWHWYLAIICNLKKMIPPDVIGSEDVKEEVLLAKDTAADACNSNPNLEQIGNEHTRSPMDLDKPNDTQIRPTSPPASESVYDSVKRPNLRSSDSPDDTGSSPNSPWIFLLDSLGNRHPKSFQCLQQYLAAEAKERMNVDLDRAGFFLSDPRKYLTLLSGKRDQQQEWAPTEAHDKRQKIRQVIHETAELHKSMSK
ncbi:hypothetical protein K450DRAFT_196016 [Umbelopsis ramanniana AG]|uniref:Ubiquitin-like protease family profile domain-containing protein n=1 Tax=Umbelopsis ramanniana AG TaxID=1314678 RepID=A0AAD5EIA4_UMBRA|nr:uncharacterized protein K450DRAFT_196016 [Umbelopsis ramanniana AG]KAI8583744.1 hypothetical protein K450DRAFT_196016 [Umbelopsis ramanniana AG]